MPLKKSTGNMYPWVTHTWNPIRGKCGYDCSYCYVKKWGTPGPIFLYDRELRANLDRDNYIFVCSGCDIFHDDIPKQWINRVKDWTEYFPDNTYLWHTKNPRRALDFQNQFGRDDILCVTVESNIPWPGISKAPQPYDRIHCLSQWPEKLMITIEPIMDFDLMTFSDMLIGCDPIQVNIGADSGRNNLQEPTMEVLEGLIELLEPHTKVYLKNNLRRILPHHKLYREFL